MTPPRLAVLAPLSLALLAVLAIVATQLPREAPERAREAAAMPESGDGFDFYVLALSWSPSYCEVTGRDADPRQCRSKPHAFIVHGLWPQYERGYPESCPTERSRNVPQRRMDAMFDLMPSSGLIVHEWRKHGTCTDLSQEDFFRLVRAARERIVVPPEFTAPDASRSVDPDAVEDAFRKANAGLGASAIAVTCDRRYLRDVRICLTKQLEFRGCEEVDRDRCRLDEVLMPPVAGG